MRLNKFQKQCFWLLLLAREPGGGTAGAFLMMESSKETPGRAASKTVRATTTPPARHERSVDPGSSGELTASLVCTVRARRQEIARFPPPVLTATGAAEADGPSRC